MARHIVKVEHGPGNTRINIPRVVVRKMGWSDVRYVIIEDHHDDILIVRRFIDDQSLDG